MGVRAFWSRQTLQLSGAERITLVVLLLVLVGVNCFNVANTIT